MEGAYVDRPPGLHDLPVDAVASLFNHLRSCLLASRAVRAAFSDDAIWQSLVDRKFGGVTTPRSWLVAPGAAP